MPYKINWETRYVSFEYFGVVTSEDIISSNQQVYGDSRFDSLRWQLVSFDKTESIAFKTSDIRLIAYMDKAASHTNPNITVAFVGKTKILEEVAAEYDAVSTSTNWPLLHFESCEEAISYFHQTQN